MWNEAYGFCQHRYKYVYAIMFHFCFKLPHAYMHYSNIYSFLVVTTDNFYHPFEYSHFVWEFVCVAVLLLLHIPIHSRPIPVIYRVYGARLSFNVCTWYGRNRAFKWEGKSLKLSENFWIWIRAATLLWCRLWWSSKISVFVSNAPKITEIFSFGTRKITE